MSLTQKIMATTEHKNRLNTIFQRLFSDIPPPKYKYGQPGQGHNPPWQCTIHLDNEHIGTGWGINQHYASEAAAESAIKYLHLTYHAQCPQAFRK